MCGATTFSKTALDAECFTPSVFKLINVYGECRCPFFANLSTRLYLINSHLAELTRVVIKIKENKILNLSPTSPG
jgi:hypothetical protein